MNQLRQLFRDLADVPAPPSRLSAASVYAAASRRRRTRFGAAAAGVASAVAVVMVGAFGGLGATGDGTPNPVPSPGWQNYIHDGAVLSVAAADRDHLYAVIAACPSKDPHYEEPWNCNDQLFGSDDSGRTWTLRDRNIDRQSVAALAPGVLTTDPDVARQNGGIEQSRQSPPSKPGTLAPSSAGPQPVSISLDGGHTWSRWTARDNPTPVPAVPAQGWLACHWTRPQTGCTLYANDAGTGRSSPLANPPGLDVEQVDDLPATAGIWVSGQDPHSEYPAVGVSTDQGRTWTTHVFGPGESDHPAGGSYLQAAAPASIDGRTAYTVVEASNYEGAPGKAFVYRTSDGGATWQRMDPGHTLSFTADGQSYLAADGTHVVYNLGRVPAVWSISGNGGESYQPATRLTGLGALRDPRGLAVAAGAYLAWDNDNVYRSADGIHWSRLPVPRN
ncbi:MAG TPA: hypothetical protein VGJ07_21900 [Rugosimonospora sp.]